MLAMMSRDVTSEMSWASPSEPQVAVELRPGAERLVREQPLNPYVTVTFTPLPRQAEPGPRTNERTERVY